jgi:hypothetical protein
MCHPYLGEVNAMIILLTAIAVLITGVPLTAVVLVTLASWHEEHARSIAGRPPGVLTGAARRLLGFRATGIARPAARSVARDLRSPTWLAGEPDDDLDPIGGPALVGGSLPVR